MFIFTQNTKSDKTDKPKPLKAIKLGFKSITFRRQETKGIWECKPHLPRAQELKKKINRTLCVKPNTVGRDGQVSMHFATPTSCSFPLYLRVHHRESTSVDGYRLGC
jgi:hypothetical protein